MTTSEFAARLGLTDSALRYYERVGVLQPVLRRSNGYREFRDADVTWMEFVLRLKATGMPLSGIIEYARLREDGPATIRDRKALLLEHEGRIRAELDERQAHLKKIQEKIEYYRSLETG